MKNPCSVSAGRVEDTEQRRNDTLPPSATRILPFLSSRQTMTNNDIEQPSPPEVVVDAATSSYPPLPLLEATLVDDKVYDAVAIDDIANEAFAVCPLWWKRHPKVAVCGLVLVSTVVIAVVAGAAIAIRESIQSKQGTQPSPSPPTQEGASTTTAIPLSDKCFANRDELVLAVDQYLTTDDCPSNSNCDIGKEYGWPMKSW